MMVGLQFSVGVSPRTAQGCRTLGYFVFRCHTAACVIEIIFGVYSRESGDILSDQTDPPVGFMWVFMGLRVQEGHKESSGARNLSPFELHVELPLNPEPSEH